MNLVNLLLQQARERADQPAMIEHRAGVDRSLTFAQLRDRSMLAAGLFHQAGLGEHDRVLLLVPMSIDLYIALLGLWRIGATVVVLDTGAGLTHTRRCCESAGITAMIGVPKAMRLSLVVSSLRGLKYRWSVGRSWFAPSFSSYETHDAHDSIASVPDDHPALLTFTSGSTGQPKGAIRSHGFLKSQYAALQQAIDLQPGEIDLATLPIFALSNLAAGVTTLIPDADLRRVGAVNGSTIVAQMQRHRPTRCTASPAFFHQLLATGRSLPMLRKVYTGGAPVFPSLMDRLGVQCPAAQLIAVYGSTEAEPIAELDWASITGADRQRMRTGGGLLTGHVVPQTQLRIIHDHSGEPIEQLTPGELEQATLPAGQVGEIIVTGDHVLRGYVDVRHNAETKVHVGEQSWHRTGDAGCLDESGRLWLMGRASAKINDPRGVLYPFAVECAADDLPNIDRTALICRDGKRLLVVQTSSGKRDVVAAQLTGRLAWAAMDAMMFTDHIPLDRRHNAKVDYPALQSLVQNSSPRHWMQMRHNP